MRWQVQKGVRRSESVKDWGRAKSGHNRPKVSPPLHDPSRFFSRRFALPSAPTTFAPPPPPPPPPPLPPPIASLRFQPPLPSPSPHFFFSSPNATATTLVIILFLVDILFAAITESPFFVHPAPCNLTVPSLGYHGSPLSTISNIAQTFCLS